jgi:hypothetical protein
MKMAKKKRAKGNMIVSLKQLSQDINLKEYLGDTPTAKQKKLFAELAIDVIENRTLDGRTINGGKFKKYSKEYADAKGVTRDSVDLFLKGKMLDGLGRRKSKEKSGTVFVQMKKGKETLKAFNHNTGDTLPKREFFGLTDEEAKAIAKEIAETKEEKRKASAGTGTSLSELRAAIDLLDIEQVD